MTAGGQLVVTEGRKGPHKDRELHATRISMGRVFAPGIAGWILFGVLLFSWPSEVMADEPAFFPDPKTAVTETARLLRSKSWPELARYYDLSGTDVAAETLTSGSFFVREKRPEVSHPAGFWRYKQPFAPSFRYMSHSTVGDDEIEVTVYVRIDQGGGMVQEGRNSFRMRKSKSGYRLLPKSVR